LDATGHADADEVEEGARGIDETPGGGEGGCWCMGQAGGGAAGSLNVDGAFPIVNKAARASGLILLVYSATPC
ncbi:hypothetical protein RTBOTA2_002666, partial [Rhodotorula toruloides]